MRVVHLLYRDSSELGGSFSVGKTLADALLMDGVDLQFVFAYGGQGPIGRSHPDRVHYIGAKRCSDLRGWLRFRRTLAEIKPDILHFMNVVNWMNIASFDWPGPKVYHVHGPLDPRTTRPVDAVLWRLVGTRASKAVFVSHDLLRMVRPAGWFRDGQCVVVHNAIPPMRDRTAKQRGELRRKIGVTEDAIVLGHIGRQVVEKGGMEAVRLMALLPVQFRLIVGGDGPELPVMKSEAERLGLQERVVFTGWLEEPSEVMKSLDLLLFLSWTEPFGLVFGEAMAHCIPVVGLHGTGGYREGDTPLIHPEASILLERGEGRGRGTPATYTTLGRLADTLIQLADNPSRAQRMGRFGQDWIRENFSSRRQAERVMGVYECLRKPAK